MENLRPKVVVVDDDCAVLGMLTQIIRNFGLDVISYSDPMQALLTIQSRNDLAALICDYEMPGMDGVELAAVAKKKNPKVAAFIFSGVFPPEMRSAPWDAWFLKGAHMMELLKHLQQTVRVSGSVKAGEGCNHQKSIA